MKYFRECAARYKIKAELKDKKIAEERKKLERNLDRLLAPTIPNFFGGSCVFITGGTGFVGKVLTEKLLRCCPDIDKYFFLIRPKKGKNPEERIKELFESELFAKLNRENPDAIKKVVPIVGDVSELGLGLSEDDRMLLQHKVSVVFHSAATVRFDDPFHKTVILNCRGTREVLELCKSMLRLKVMVHISTTYCNTDYAVNEEVVHPSHVHWKDIIKLAETNNPDQLQTLHYKLIGKHPNIYTFTKRVAENIVNDYRYQVPVIIGRPSVVMSTVADPIPGWWDTIMGPPSFNVGYSTGVVRVLYADYKTQNEFFAVDYVVRELILLAWLRGCNLKISEQSLRCFQWGEICILYFLKVSQRDQNQLKQMVGVVATLLHQISGEIFICRMDLLIGTVQCNDNTTSWNVNSKNPQEIDVINMTVQDLYDVDNEDMLKSGKEVLALYPPIGIWAPKVIMTTNKFYFTYKVLTAHVLFAIFVDALLRIAGQKPRLLRIYRRAQFANMAMKYFLCNTCTSKCDNYTRSISFLKEEDFKNFNQILAFDFVKYGVDAKLGVDKYIIRREMDYRWNRRLQQILQVIDWIWTALKLYLVYLIIHWIIK